MSNEQHPNPWSRDAWKAIDEPRADEPTTSLSSAPGQQYPQPAQPRPVPAAQPQPSPAQGFLAQQFSTQSGPTPGSVPPPNYPPPSYPYGQPVSSPSPAVTKARGRSRIAGALAVAVLAAGVGGGAGFTAARLSTMDAATTSASASTVPTETQVVQADPNNPNWTAVAAAASDAVVAIQVTGQDGSGGQGSGVVIDGAGYIVTNNHVVSGSGSGAQIVVLLGDMSYVAEIVGADPSTDLAVIKLVDPPSDLTVMSYADESQLAVGDPVMAIGNPLGLADTVTTGIVSALNRPVTTRAVTNNTVGQGQQDVVVTAAIQTNAAINPGNSGGALVNASGELVGITSSIASLASSSDTAGNIGIGFAIGADQVQYVAEQLIATGVAQHPQIGISASDINSTGQLGAAVAEVVAGSPAEAAGLQVGDLVTAVDGKAVTSTESLVALVRAGRVGRDMTVSVVRGGQDLEFVVTPIAAAR
ncbi:S1C family serine protease [Tessaracoccus sp. G1721]